jgi:hypothetical protein
MPNHEIDNRARRERELVSHVPCSDAGLPVLAGVVVAKYNITFFSFFPPRLDHVLVALRFAI